MHARVCVVPAGKCVGHAPPPPLGEHRPARSFRPSGSKPPSVATKHMRQNTCDKALGNFLRLESPGSRPGPRGVPTRVGLRAAGGHGRPRGPGGQARTTMKIIISILIMILVTVMIILIVLLLGLVIVIKRGSRKAGRSIDWNRTVKTSVETYVEGGFDHTCLIDQGYYHYMIRLQALHDCQCQCHLSLLASRLSLLPEVSGGL